MIGETVSHYRILEMLGAGGMGVVYKAEDTRLKRLVALKFLPLELTRDVEAKERLMLEAQSASALDHPNICTIHEIDETRDGRVFLAMAYYDGETLKQRLSRGPLSVAEAVDIAAQLARAVAAAHDAHIIHRDIKSANVIVTRRGDVKLVDFGLAKLSGQTALTRTGATVGTVAYMAPEQIAGVAADERSDVWALGVVLYEMLTGVLPFKADNDAAMLNAILNATPRPPRELCPDVPPELERVVLRALEKEPLARFTSARELLDALPGRTPSSATLPMPALPAPRAPASRRPILLVAAAVVLLAAVGAVWRSGRERSATEAKRQLVTRLAELAARDQYAAAFALARSAEPSLRNDPEFAALWTKVASPQSVATNPPGASVSVRDVAQQTPWQSIGTTPLTAVRVPAGMARWKIEKSGYVTQEFVGTVGLNIPIVGGITGTIDLVPAGSKPTDMVRIPPGPLQLVLTGYDYNKSIPAGEYLIDKYEVTNKQFKAFVDAGGYTTASYWQQPFVRGGRTIPWQQAVAEFRDQTGRQGPSTWEVGSYPAGQDDYPVSGVSWYEAAAYAQFAGKSLPTVYHWLRAAGTGAAAEVTVLSNFHKANGLMAVGSSGAVSTAGLFDTAGNVKEWCLNEMQPGVTRYILGGAWNEPDYMFIYPDARSPFDRSATNGFRCAKYLQPTSLPAATTLAIARPVRDYGREKPVSDEAFRAYKNLYAYDATPLAERVDGVDESAEAWRREKVSFAAGYGAERVPAYVFLPKQAKPPYQPVLYWPGSGALRVRSSASPVGVDGLEFLIASGRAVIYPIYYGTYERNTGRDSTWPDQTRAYRDWLMKQISDARRAVDYISARPDMRRDQIGYYGVSWGGRMSSIVLSVEPRLRAAVLASGGFSPGEAPPETDPFNFASRVTVPVLMLNGSRDFIFEVELSQKPLFEQLGSPAGTKKHLVFDGGHGIFYEKRSQVIRETLDWFDRYLGPAR